jgi:hypothetical protein
MGIGQVGALPLHVQFRRWLVLAMPTITSYFVLLARIDHIALSRCEVLESELCRA